MKGLVWTEKKQLEVLEVKDPQITTANDVKIAIKYAGFCGTDLQVIKGNEDSPFNIVRGHEAVGTIVEVGENVKSLVVGDRVVIDPNQYCGECYYCRKGQTNFCEAEGGFAIAGCNMDGMFAEKFVCDQRFAYKLPDSMSFETGLMVEPLACILNNVFAADVKPDESVLILGSGPMGIIAQMVCKRSARLTVATELNDFRYKFAKEIADVVYKPDELTLENVEKINNGRKFDVIIDTVGTQLGVAEKLIEKGGRIVPIAINPSYEFTFVPTHYVVNAIKIIGAGEYNMLFDTAIKIASNMPELGKLLTKAYPVEEYKKAISDIIGYNIDTNEKNEISSMKTAFEF